MGKPQRKWKFSWEHSEGMPTRKLGVSIIGGIKNVWFIVENLIKVDDLGVQQFQETTISTMNSELSKIL